MNIRGILLATALATASMTFAGALAPAYAATEADLNKDSDQALQTLYKLHPFAERLSHNAKAILIFPNVVKAGLIFGGAYGEGELQQGSKIDGYYNSVTGSWGLQAGAQSYSYVVFLMNDKAVANVEDSSGFAAGTSPSVVIVDKSAAAAVDTSMIDHDVYAFPFNGKGLMANLTLQGTKISHIHPK